MFVDGARDLQRGQHQPTRRVQHDIERDSRISEVDGAQHFLRVVHVDIAKYRKAEEAHRLLPVHQQDDAGVPLALDLGDEPLA